MLWVTLCWRRGSPVYCSRSFRELRFSSRRWRCCQESHDGNVVAANRWSKAHHRRTSGPMAGHSSIAGARLPLGPAQPVMEEWAVIRPERSVPAIFANAWRVLIQSVFPLSVGRSTLFSKARGRTRIITELKPSEGRTEMATRTRSLFAYTAAAAAGIFGVGSLSSSTGAWSGNHSGPG